MAYQESRLVRYERVMDAAGTAIVRIFAAGKIYDSEHLEPRYTEYWIEGYEMATIPQPDPVLYPNGVAVDGTIDPHVVAVRQILAREAKRAHMKWMAELAARPPAPVVRPPELVEATPPILAAELPETLPDEEEGV